MLLLDTHVVHWLAANDPRLGKQARNLIAVSAPHALCVSVISFWELDQLLRKKKFEPPIVGYIHGLRAGLVASGYQLLDLGLDAVFAAEGLSDFHGAPGDRFLAGTASAHGLDFMTADRKILAWPGPLKRIDAHQ